MKRIPIAFVLGILVATAPLWAAVDKRVFWTTPQQRVNGDALTTQEIAAYEVECLAAGGDRVFAGTATGTELELRTDAVFEDGDYFCRVRVIDTDGRPSAWGNSEPFTVGRCEATDCSPMPPEVTVSFGQQ